VALVSFCGVLCCVLLLQGLPDTDVVRVLPVCIMKSINMTGKNQMQIMQVSRLWQWQPEQRGLWGGSVKGLWGSI
jgi:hypothetical protein